MNVKNILLTLLTSLLFCYGSLVLADDAPSNDDQAVQMTVNINTADADTLATVLVGVGVSRAYAIVEYRETHGKFYSAEELTAVRGIGDATVAKNADRIVVE